MKNLIQDGVKTVDFIVPAGGVISGNGYLLSSLFAVAIASGPAGETVAFARQGGFILPKATGAGTGFAQGTKLYWDNTAKVITKTVATNTLIGFALTAAADDSATADTLLTGVT
jgi:predicted RecA/RadA family phage recombinase